MELAEKGKAELISGIESDARVEEEQIIKEAEKLAAEKRKYSEKKIEALLNDARSEAQKQSEAIMNKMLSAVELELRRHSMSDFRRDSVFLSNELAKTGVILGSLKGPRIFKKTVAGVLVLIGSF